METRNRKPGNILRRNMNIIPRILLHLRKPRDQINVLRLPDLRPVDNLPPKVKDWEHADHRIREEECRDVPVAGKEDLIAAYEGHHARAHRGDIRHVGLASAAVGEGLAGYALGHAGFSEPSVGEGDDGEVDQLGCGHLLCCMLGGDFGKW